MFVFAGFPGEIWPDRAVWGRRRTSEVKGRGRVPKRTERRKCEGQRTDTVGKAMKGSNGTQG